MRVLFIAWDGPQVHYLETLFVPIFAALRNHGVEFHILQFTWANRKQRETIFDVCAQHGIPYVAASVIRNPLRMGACLTVLNGRRLIKKLARQWSIDVLMPRSTLPALMCLTSLERSGLPLVFDADGLPLDERVDFAGESVNSWVQKFLRRVEAYAVCQADTVLTRTSIAVDILSERAGELQDRAKFHVVGNGRDSNAFTSMSIDCRAQAKHELGLHAYAPLLVFAGSLGEQYCLPEMFKLIGAIKTRCPDAGLLILTGDTYVACNALLSQPELQQAVVVKSVKPEAVPQYLACADLGLALRRPAYSMQAVAPIKIGEYLLSGIPVVATKGIGDTAALDDRVAFLVERMSDEELYAAAQWFVDSVLPDRALFALRCRELGCEAYSLDASVQAYVSAFKQMADSPNRGLSDL